MIQAWKVPHIVKGVLSNIGPLTTWHFRAGHTGVPPHHILLCRMESVPSLAARCGFQTARLPHG